LTRARTSGVQLVYSIRAVGFVKGLLTKGG
jgi:hypothetical protein